MARNDSNKRAGHEASPNGNTALMPALAEDPERVLADELLARAREQGIDLVGPDGLLTKVTKNVLESALGAELTEHLGYDAHDPAGRGSGNSRNGTTRKVVHTDVGPVTFDVPRDRDGSFSPVIVPKHSRLNGLPEAVTAVWPNADVQTCVVHLVRNTLRYTSRQHWAKITTDLRTVYTAATLDAATERFAEFEEQWGLRVKS